MIYAGMLETWWGGSSYMDTARTLFIELWGSFLVFMIAMASQDCDACNGRFLVYAMLIFIFISLESSEFLNVMPVPP